MLSYESNEKLNIAHLREVENMFNTSLSKMGLSDMTVTFKHIDRNVYASGCNTVYSVYEDKVYRACKNALYGLLSTLTNENKAWGAMTGVKPVKLYIMCLEAGFSPRKAYMYLKRYYSISDSKIKLIHECAMNQMDLLYAPNNSFSLYVHIPLCTTKCSYCSFPSQVCQSEDPIVESYLYALLKELKSIREYAYINELFCDCVYIGGGTPSIFSSSQIKRLLNAINEIAVKPTEVTFEAGRCDTLNEEKLSQIKEGKVTRISINPQTTNDDTLRAVGRPADSDLFFKTYEKASKVGFDCINCDIILALQGEGYEDFDRSINDIVALKAENITLHSLCKKKTSLIETEAIQNKDIALCAYHDTAREKLKAYGYEAYYAYRQQHAVDNAENVGYSLNDKQCVYNIRMMGERQTILSAGAGSTSKVYNEENKTFRSIYNMKNTSLYIKNIDSIIQKKLLALEKLSCENN